MSLTHILRESTIARSARVMQLEGIFDLPASKVNRVEWDMDIDLEERDWNVGLIVGPSGCGKTTLATELFGEFNSTFEWSRNQTVVDDFPEHMSIKEITELLSRVGFSSPPSWLRPFNVLSNGEQFRVQIARLMASTDDVIVVDEFTSVVDRTVAQISSNAIARAVRGRGQKLVAVTCHYDVTDWLQPDWVIEPTGDNVIRLTWRELQRRPELSLTIKRVHPAAWNVFRQHHYLNNKMYNIAHCFVGYLNDEPVAFLGVAAFPHATKPAWRQARLVCLPDYQGLGIGERFSNFVASLYGITGKPYRGVTSHPASMASRHRSPLWRMIRAPSRVKGQSPARARKEPATGTRSVLGGFARTLGRTHAVNRMTASFQFVGESNDVDAIGFDIPAKRKSTPSTR